MVVLPTNVKVTQCVYFELVNDHSPDLFELVSDTCFTKMSLLHTRQMCEAVA